MCALRRTTGPLDLATHEEVLNSLGIPRFAHDDTFLSLRLHVILATLGRLALFCLIVSLLESRSRRLDSPLLDNPIHLARPLRQVPANPDILLTQMIHPVPAIKLPQLPVRVGVNVAALREVAPRQAGFVRGRGEGVGRVFFFEGDDIELLALCSGVWGGLSWAYEGHGRCLNDEIVQVDFSPNLEI
jgi:hypothetical protein